MQIRNYVPFRVPLFFRMLRKLLILVPERGLEPRTYALRMLIPLGNRGFIGDFRVFSGTIRTLCATGVTLGI